jgi:NADH-quinone oxidoreductase subunit C
VDVHEQSVPSAQWRVRCAELATAGADMLDFLTGVDEPGSGEIEVVVHLVDVQRRSRHLLRTRVDRGAPELDSLVEALPGAAWHEREAHEMLGVRFLGNPDLRPLLTTGEMGHPLRRTTPLPARVQAPWPGAFDPSDRPPDTGGTGGRVPARPRSRSCPPGVPPEWTAPSTPAAAPGPASPHAAPPAPAPERGPA